VGSIRSRRLFVVALVFSFVTITVVVGVAAFGTTDVVLAVETESGETVVSEPVDEESEIRIEYIHSVEKTPVIQHYTIEDTTLVLSHSEFRSYGAGLPSTAEVEHTDDGAFLRQIDEPRERITLRPGETAGHILVVDDEEFDLVSLAEEGSVEIETTERTGIEMLRDRGTDGD
jgi:hypothetical protein